MFWWWSEWWENNQFWPRCSCEFIQLASSLSCWRVWVKVIVQLASLFIVGRLWLGNRVRVHVKAYWVRGSYVQSYYVNSLYTNREIERFNLGLVRGNLGSTRRNLENDPSVFGFSLTLMDSFWREIHFSLFNLVQREIKLRSWLLCLCIFFPLFKLLIMRGISVIPSGIIGSVLASVTWVARDYVFLI